MEAELKDTQKALDNLVKAVEMVIFSETTQKRLTELEARKRGLQDAIEAERARSELMQDASVLSAIFPIYLSKPQMHFFHTPLIKVRFSNPAQILSKA